MSKNQAIYSGYHQNISIKMNRLVVRDHIIMQGTEESVMYRTGGRNRDMSGIYEAD